MARSSPELEAYVPPEVAREAEALIATGHSEAVNDLRLLTAIHRSYARLAMTDGNAECDVSNRLLDKMAALEDRMLNRPVRTDGDILTVLLVCTNKVREMIDAPENDDVTVYCSLGRVIERLAGRVGVDLQEANEFEEPGEPYSEHHPQWRPNGFVQVLKHPVFGIDRQLIIKDWLSKFVGSGGGITFRIVEHREFTDADFADLQFGVVNCGEDTLDGLQTLLARKEAPDFPTAALKDELMLLVLGALQFVGGLRQPLPVPSRWHVRSHIGEAKAFRLGARA